MNAKVHSKLHDDDIRFTKSGPSDKMFAVIALNSSAVVLDHIEVSYNSAHWSN